jgi:hypothetical protein
MVGRLITLPMRLSLRVAAALLRTVFAPERVEQPPPPRPVQRPTRQPARQPARQPTRQPTRPVPAHVSEQPVLVQQSAEPGAEDGAGANVVVDEPWEGYRELNAKEVIARLRGADSAALAAVELYESDNRNRQTVLAAVRRQLQSNNGSN